MGILKCNIPVLVIMLRTTMTKMECDSKIQDCCKKRSVVINPFSCDKSNGSL